MRRSGENLISQFFLKKKTNKQTSSTKFVREKREVFLALWYYLKTNLKNRHCILVAASVPLINSV